MPTLNTNLTTTAGLSPTMQTYYDRLMLEWYKSKSVFTQFGQKRPIPTGGGKTINFRKWDKFGPAITPLTEGTPPDGQALSMTEIEATVAQYGDYVAVSDLLEMTALDPVIRDATQLMADQGVQTVETLTLNTLSAGTNVLYAGGKTARNTLANTDRLTSLEVRKAKLILENNHANKFGTDYIAVVSPEDIYDIMSDDLWIAVSEYQDKNNLYNGELGKWLGFRFVASDNTGLLIAGAGATGADVKQSFFFGTNAYGVVDIAGSMGIKSIIKPKGSAGTADPLDQVSTIGWKVDAYVAAILDNDWMVRVETGAGV